MSTNGKNRSLHRRFSFHPGMLCINARSSSDRRTLLSPVAWPYSSRLFFVAGAIFEVAVSLFVADAIFREIWNAPFWIEPSRVRPPVAFQSGASSVGFVSPHVGILFRI